jgi:hypothetical protein
MYQGRLIDSSKITFQFLRVRGCFGSSTECPDKNDKAVLCQCDNGIIPRCSSKTFLLFWHCALGTGGRSPKRASRLACTTPGNGSQIGASDTIAAEIPADARQIKETPTEAASEPLPPRGSIWRNTTAQQHQSGLLRCVAVTPPRTLLQSALFTSDCSCCGTKSLQLKNRKQYHFLFATVFCMTCRLFSFEDCLRRTQTSCYVHGCHFSTNTNIATLILLLHFDSTPLVW